jgi:uncharacterized protein YgbK (DUF1537 family)
MIGVIADDLTGAAELGGIGIRHGLSAEVIRGGRIRSERELLCVDTDSRSCPPREAARRAATAATQLQKAGAIWIYKKVDSVLRGNVIAEVRAIRNALGLRSVLLIPANPRFGRQIHQGRYYVNGKPIHRTDFARDPEYPRSSSKVLEMLGARKADAVTVSRLKENTPTSGIVLGEVSSSADVQQWATRRSAEMLPAGGAEFFGALLKVMSPVEKKISAVKNVRKRIGGFRELFVCGSASDFTFEFVNVSRKNRTPVFSLLGRSDGKFSLTASFLERIAEQAVLAFQSQPRVILAIGRPLIEKRGVGHDLTTALVEIANLVLVRTQLDHVYAEGGATAAKLVQRLGWNRMTVVRELAPGVTTLSFPDRERPLLTIKPGSYPGWPA